MTTIDLAALTREASEQAAKKVCDELRNVVREELDRRDADRLLSRADLAKLLGISTRAFAMRLRRGSDLTALSFEIDGRQVWRRSSVLASFDMPHRKRKHTNKNGGL